MTSNKRREIAADYIKYDFTFIALVFIDGSFFNIEVGQYLLYILDCNICNIVEIFVGEFLFIFGILIFDLWLFRRFLFAFLFVFFDFAIGIINRSYVGVNPCFDSHDAVFISRNDCIGYVFDVLIKRRGRVFQSLFFGVACEYLVITHNIDHFLLVELRRLMIEEHSDRSSILFIFFSIIRNV